LPIAYDNAFGFTARSLSFLKYINQSVSVAKKLNNVDVCYAISVPLTIGLAAIWLKKKIKLPYIFEVGDLWPDAPVQMGFVKNYILVSLLFRLEKFLSLSRKSLKKNSTERKSISFQTWPIAIFTNQNQKILS
jgi:hypothetical protein